MMNNTLTVRLAIPEDALDILCWRNDPLARAMSRTNHPIEEQEHLAWYRNACRDPGCLLAVGVVDGISIGVVRFDRRAPSTWEANIVLAPHARGRGLGRCLLEAGLGQLNLLHGESKVVAEIRKCNTASIHLFESSGFRLMDTGPNFCHYERTVDVDSMELASGESEPSRSNRPDSKK